MEGNVDLQGTENDELANDPMKAPLDGVTLAT
jgi:hypothetical protein